MFTTQKLLDELITLIRQQRINVKSKNTNENSFFTRRLITREFNISATLYKNLLKNIDRKILVKEQENVIKLKNKVQKIIKKYEDIIEVGDEQKKDDKIFLEDYDEYTEDNVKEFENNLKNIKKELLKEEKKKKRENEKKVREELLLKARELGFKGRKNATLKVLQDYINKEELVLRRLEKKLAAKEKKTEARQKKEQRSEEHRKRQQDKKQRRKEYHVVVDIFYKVFKGKEEIKQSETSTFILQTRVNFDENIDALVQEEVERFTQPYGGELDYYVVKSNVAVNVMDDPQSQLLNRPLQGTVYTVYDSYMDKTEQKQNDCVLHYLKNHLYPVAKKLTDEKLLEIMNTTKDNVTVEHIKLVADKYKVPLYVFYLDNSLLCKYDFKGMWGRFSTREEFEEFEKENKKDSETIKSEFIPRNKKIDAMMITVGNNHLYPITDKFMRKSIVEKHKGKVRDVQYIKPENDEKKEESIETTVIDYLDEDVLSTIDPSKNHMVVVSKQNDLIGQALSLFEKDKTIYAIKTEGNTVKNIKYKNTLIIANNEYKETEEVAQTLFEDYSPSTLKSASQTKSSIIQRYFKERITIPDSNISQYLEEALIGNDFRVCGWTEYFVSKPASECISMDIAKCDTTNLIFNKHPVLRYLEQVEDYNGEEIQAGYYFLESNCLFSGGGGWKTYTLIDHLLKEKLIQRTDIKKKIVATEVWDGEKILPHIEELYKLCPQQAKELTNRFIGCMNKKKIIEEQTGVVTNTLFDVDILVNKYKQEGYHAHATELFDGIVVIDPETNKPEKEASPFYQIKAYKHKLHPENKALIYKNIVESRYIMIMKIIKAVLGFIPKTKQELVENGVYAIKTDNVVFDKALEEKIKQVVQHQQKTHALFGFFRIEEVTKDLKKSANKDVKSVNFQSFQKEHINNLEWKNNQTFSLEHPSVELLMKHKGALILGLAGSGKTTLITNLAQAFEKQNFTVKMLSFTNTASRKINGETLCKYFGISSITKKINPSKIKKLIKNDTVFINDEVSQIPAYVMNILSQVKKVFSDDSKQVLFYFAGDFKQTKAVEKNSHLIKYEDNNILKELTNQNKIVLKTQYRSNAEYVEKCSEQNFEDIIQNERTDPTKINICFTHKVRKQINKEWMEKEKASKNEVIHITMEQLDYDKITDGMIKSSKATDTKKGFEIDQEFVDEEFVKSLFDKQKECCYCNRKWACGDRKPTLERINNKKGHIKSNCLLACKNCNETRSNRYTHEQFMTYIKDDIVKKEDDRQEMWIYEGLPMIARKSNKKFKVVNSVFYDVISVSDKVVTLKEYDSNSNIVFDLKKDGEVTSFRDLLLPRYCMTCHKTQGATITEPYTIHEWKKMDEEMKFTAATRTNNPHNVFIKN